MKVLLIATYELGRQPFGLASPAAWLERDGCVVRCLDLSVEPLADDAVVEAELIALHVPMHTATRLAVAATAKIRKLNPRAHLCFYGLYAPLNEAYLRRCGADSILGGEFERDLVAVARRLRGERAEADDARGPVSLERLRFLPPSRAGLPPLAKYAALQLPSGERRRVGYTEATRGCKHRCRHCPIVPVYDGRFRVVQREVVLEDIRRQVRAGAEHVTFGDPDFFNGPTHAQAIVRALNEEFPQLTYDVTIKVEHLLRHADKLPELRRTGCLLITTAVESFDDRVLALLDKGHTRAEFDAALTETRAVGLELNPTFLPFTPWITRQGYLAFLRTIVELGLADHVAPVQYAVRLLVPPSSRLLELAGFRPLVGELDEERLAHPWSHPDAEMDRLHERITAAVHCGQHEAESRRELFLRVWRLASAICEESVGERLCDDPFRQAPAAATVPYLTEPWYC